MRRWGVRSQDVGQLHVISASLLDRSKSMKTELMALIEASGGAVAEGVDALSDTTALLGCVSWSQGASWDGMIVVHATC